MINFLKPSKVASKWLRRIGTLGLWAYFIYLISPLYSAFPPPAEIQNLFAQEYRWARILAYVLLVIIVHRVFGFRAFVYIATFPIWAPSVAIWNFLKIIGFILGLVLKILGVNNKLFNNAASAKVGAACYVLVPICYFAIHDSTNKYVIYGAVTLLMILSYRIIYGVFRWAMKPLARLCEFLENLKSYFAKQISKEIEEIKNAETNKDSKEIKKKLDTEKHWIKGLNWLERTVLTPQRMLGLFFLVLAFSVTLIIVNYSVAYWGLNKVSIYHFQGDVNARGFWDFSYFGLMVMTTSDLSGIVPLSIFAKVLASTQIICSVLLLSMLVLAFSTSGNTDVGEAASSLKEILSARKEIQARLKRVDIIEDAEVEEIDQEEDKSTG